MKKIVLFDWSFKFLHHGKVTFYYVQHASKFTDFASKVSDNGDIVTISVHRLAFCDLAEDFYFEMIGGKDFNLYGILIRYFSW